MKIFDVTVPISAEMPVYEGDPRAEINSVASIAKGDASNVSQIRCSVHAGTHVDAPSHFFDDAKKVHELELEKLVGECLVIELSADVNVIKPEHLTTIERAERVLFKTRNSEFWSEMKKDFRTDFTYISAEAAHELTAKNIKLVGIDYLSIDKFDSEDFPAHKILLENEVVILESLDLREVSGGVYEIICLPLKYVAGAGDGAPARTILRQK